MDSDWLVERLRKAALKIALSPGADALHALADELEAESDRIDRKQVERMYRREFTDEEWTDYKLRN